VPRDGQRLPRLDDEVRGPEANPNQLGDVSTTVLTLLAADGPASAVDLAARTGATLVAVMSALQRMRRRELVTVVSGKLVCMRKTHQAWAAVPGAESRITRQRKVAEPPLPPLPEPPEVPVYRPGVVRDWHGSMGLLTVGGAMECLVCGGLVVITPSLFTDTESRWDCLRCGTWGAISERRYEKPYSQQLSTVDKKIPERA